MLIQVGTLARGGAKLRLIRDRGACTSYVAGIYAPRPAVAFPGTFAAGVTMGGYGSQRLWWPTVCHCAAAVFTMPSLAMVLRAAVLETQAVARGEITAVATQPALNWHRVWVDVCRGRGVSPDFTPEETRQ